MIEFAIGTGAQTISPTSALPTITETVAILGSTQPGFSGVPLIEIDGSSAGIGVPGLDFADADDSLVESLIINRFDEDGISMFDTDDAVVRDSYIGTNAAGTGDEGNLGSGIVIVDGSNNIVEDNLISGNDFNGVTITVSAGVSLNNIVRGNLIGTDITGELDLGNVDNGVLITSSTANTIGGLNASDQNVISGNDGAGVSITGGSWANEVLGNLIGTDIDGQQVISNDGRAGVWISGAGTNGNIVGGTFAGARNIISGNQGGSSRGVEISGGASLNTIQGNYIGTDIVGTVALPNTFDAVYIVESPDNTVGGSSPEAGNLLSGNDGNGIQLFGAGTTGTVIAGNLIGTNAAGTVALPNLGQGINNNAMVTGTLIGTDGDGVGDEFERNVISGNAVAGITTQSSSSDVTITGNYIGTDVTGGVALGNASYGILITGGNNTVGGDSPAERNVISANNNDGIRMNNPASTGNLVQGNYIGTDATGMSDLGNTGVGVSIINAAANNVRDNLISGNTLSGVRLQSAGATGNVVAGNFVGVDVTGTVALGNDLYGVVMQTGANNNLVGGSTPADRNILSANNTGAFIRDAGSTGNQVAGNYIGTDVTGTVAIGNTAEGVAFFQNSEVNFIGTDGDGIGDAGEGNLISGNMGDGIQVGSGSSNNTIAGNIIGLDATGTADLGNGIIGVQITASGTILGTNGDGVSDELERNIISGNQVGVQFISGTGDGNRIAGNYIGTDITGQVAIGNDSQGIIINSGFTNTIVGTNSDGNGDAAEGNVISGQIGSVGVGDGGTGTVIAGNLIGTDVDGIDPLPNSLGVSLVGQSAVVGGNTADARNIISGNAGWGIRLQNATNAQILGNFLGISSLGTPIAGQPDALEGATSSTVFVNGTVTVDGAVTFDATSTLQGDGTILGGVAANGTVAPGNSPGILSTGDFTFGDGATFEVEIGGTTAGNTDNDHDQLNVTGTVTIGNNVTLDTQQWLTFVPVTADSFTIINNDGADPVSGTFDGLPEGAVVSNFLGLGRQATISYVGGDGNDVVLTDQGVSYVVVNTNDSGAGSLRQAILDANSTLGLDTITFDIPGAGPHTISPLTGLPDITDPAFIDGYSQSGSSPNTNGPGLPNNAALTIELSGDQITDGSSGLVLTGGGNTVRGLVVNQFGFPDVGLPGSISSIPVGGIVSTGVGGDVIEGNFIGTDVSGMSALPNNFYGVYVSSPNNTLGGSIPAAKNVISGNQGFGIHLAGANATDNTIEGNFIGVDVSGATALGNTGGGIVIQDESQRNLIGGSTPGARNIISGNGDAFAPFDYSNGSAPYALSGGFGSGIHIENFVGPPSDLPNTIQGNYIGTDVTGNAPVGNAFRGVTLVFTQGTAVGGWQPGEGNVISGNANSGIAIGGTGGTPTGVTVQGNLIGTDANGLAAVPNALEGIDIDGVSGNLIGTDGDGVNDATEGNLIGGGTAGISIANSANNTVAGNEIGATEGGLTAIALPNTNGIVVVSDPALGASTNNTIGLPGPFGGNLIAGNTENGILIRGVETQSNLVQNNLIGDVNGTGLIENGFYGIVIDTDASNNTIGGELGVEGNVISGNAIHGILINFGAGGNTIQGNLIGTDPTGTSAVGNTIGIQLSDSANNVIGSSTDPALFQNIISGNSGNGISVNGPTSTNNQILGNYVGIDVLGTGAVPNQGGIAISDAPGNFLNTNVIAANVTHGVLLRGSGTANNVLEGNIIGDSVGNPAFANETGVLIDSGARDNQIGGLIPGQGNVISGNTGEGIYIFNNSGTGNTIEGNLIGTDINGDVDRGNVFHGVRIEDSPGQIVGPGNVISGNDAGGITVTGPGSTANEIAGNLIGLNLNGDGLVANGGDGISIVNASFNFIGGLTSADRNVISGNVNGIEISGASSANNKVQGNYVGLAADGVNQLGNTSNGIEIIGGSSNTIGGPENGATNVISGNDIHGVFITGVTATDNTIQGNLIGTDATGTIDVGNAFSAVAIESPQNLIGGPANADRNILSGNPGYGVVFTGDDANNNVVQGNYIGTDITGGEALGNDTGGVFSDSARDNFYLENVISGNGIITSGVGDGIQIAGGVGVGGGNTIQGNLIGTDALGLTPIPNEAEGIQIATANNLVGGLEDGDENVISNNRTGVLLLGPSATQNDVQGNVIGLDITGQVALPNGTGVFINNGSNNTIGGADPLAANVISGNTGRGVVVEDGGSNSVVNNLIGTNIDGDTVVGNGNTGVAVEFSTNNVIDGNTIGGNATGISLFAFDFPIATTVQRNFVGTNANGTDLGNTGAGIVMFEAHANVIGGATSDLGNTIRFNDVGIRVGDTFGNTVDNSIRLNNISNNVGLGIDLGNDGASANDAGDADPGSNNLQNFPEFTGVVSLETGLFTVPYVVDADAANATYPITVDFYLADFDGEEGETFVVSDTFLESDFTNGGKSLAIADPGVRVGDVIVATATDAAGNTSEFSASAEVRSSTIIFVTNTNDSGAGSLREAILNANGTAGPDTIFFNLPAGPQTIQPTSALPAITEAVVLDATTHTDAVEVDGSLAGAGVDGLVLQSSDIEIIGLTINSFSDDAIQVEGDNNIIIGNFLGVDLNGTTAAPNGGAGVNVVSGIGNTVGGSSGDGNVIGGNDIGVRLQSTSSATSVASNLIGIGADESTAVGNTTAGILVEGADNEIGSAGGNVIGGSQTGILISGAGADSNTIEQNYIGTDANGANFGNVDGISIVAGDNNTIGGPSLASANTIGLNTGDGVVLTGGAGNVVRLNSIDANGGLGIDLGGDGVTANDTLDADTGPNTLQNSPSLGSAIFGDTTTVSGNLLSSPGATYTLDFYSSVDNTATGFGERYLGTLEATTDVTGVATFFGELPRSTVAGEYVTAIATGSGGSSEFSDAVVTGGNSAPTFSILNVTIVEEDGFGYEPFDSGVNRVVFGENQLIQLIGAFTDDNFSDSHTITVDWGDGTEDIIELPASDPPQRVFGVLHQYPDDNPTGTPEDLLTISVTVTDGENTPLTVDTTPIIQNISPDLDEETLSLTDLAGNPLTDAEGGQLVDALGEPLFSIRELQTVRLLGTFEDLGPDDTHTLEVNWGDGSEVETYELVQGARTFSVAHAFESSGRTVVEVSIVDDDFDPDFGNNNYETVDADNGRDTASKKFTLNIENVPPVVDIDTTELAGPFVEGSPIGPFRATITDGPGETFDYEWEVLSNGVVIETGNDPTFTFTPENDGAYVVSLVVTDDDGAVSNLSTSAINVENLAPSIQTLDFKDEAGDPIVTGAQEGDFVTLEGTFFDPGFDPHTVVIDWGDLSPSQTLQLDAGRSTFTVDHRFIDDPSNTNDEYTVTVTVSDEVGDNEMKSEITIVNNGDPRPSIVVDPNAAPVATQVNLLALVEDPGVVDTFTYSWEVDEIAQGTVTPAPYTGTTGPTDEPTFFFDLPAGSAGSSFQVSVTVADDDGGSGISETFVISGTDQVDIITVTPGPGTDVEVTVASTGSTTTTVTLPANNPILINAFDSNDTVTVDSVVTTPVQVYGGGGNDSIVGGSGNDTITGGVGDDTIIGGEGNDELIGVSGDDTLIGEGGNDVMFLVPGSDKTVIEQPGDGIDTLNFSRVTSGNGISLDLAIDGDVTTQTGTPQVVDAANNTVTLIGEFENLVGSDFADDFKGNALNNIVEGGKGSDFIDARQGNDLVFAGGDDDSLMGGDGNDTLGGDEGDDLIFAGGDDDSLLGGDGNDTLSGDDGDDLIFAGGDDDSLTGGDGNDTLGGDEGDDLIFGGELQIDPLTNQPVLDPVTNAPLQMPGSGNDLVFAGGDDDSLYGGDGNDTLGGDEGDDLIFAGGDDDSLMGGDGNDTLGGEDGDDVIFAGGDDDSLSGGDGNDTLSGDEGDDLIFAGGDDDSLMGGDGNDTLGGGGGNDLIFAGGDDDSLTGGDGNDTLGGDEGDDLIFGGAIERDAITNEIILVNGSGDDLIFAGGDDDSLYGGDGNDTLGGDEGDDLIFAGGDDDSLVGGDGNDTLDGGGGNDLIFAGGDDDSLTGGDGNDTLEGGGGNDLIFAGGDDDSLVGGDGNDTLGGDDGDDLIFAGGDDDSLIGGDGNDTLEGGGGNDLIFAGGDDDSLIGGDGNDTLEGGGGNDLIFAGGDDDSLVGGDGNDTLDGGGGNDLIFAGGDDDSLTGGDGNDTLEGGGGNDLIFAGGDDDSLVGGDGNDTLGGDDGDDLIFAGGDDDSLIGGDGNDTLEGGGGNDLIFAGGDDDSLTGGDGNDTLEGGGGNDLIFAGGDDDSLSGGDGNDTLDGADGNDLIFAGGDDDSLMGGDGNDTLEGEDGDDLIFGNAGDDSLIGGAGDDTIVGGIGADTIDGDAPGVAPGFNTLSAEPDPSATGSSVKVTDTNLIVDGVTSTITNFSGAFLTGTDGNDTLDGSDFTGNVAMFGGDGNDTLLGSDFDDVLVGQGGDDSLQGGIGDDTYIFEGGNLGADVVDEPSLAAPDPSSDTLDFFGLAAPISSLDLSSTTAQILNAELTITLTDGQGIENVVGTPFSDLIIGNNRDNELIGAGGEDTLLGGVGADTISAGILKQVFLDFDSATNTSDNELVYSQEERDAVQSRLEEIYDDFDIEFTQTPPMGGAFITVLFNETPVINGRFHAGGKAERIGWRALNLGGTAIVDVGGFFGFGITESQVRSPLPVTTAQRNNFVALSATIAGHELAHMYGLRHIDAMGPIGFGLFEQLGSDSFVPAYPLVAPTAAIETRNHLIASPASVRTTLADALNSPFIGEREAIKLTFTDTGKTVMEADVAGLTQAVPLNTDISTTTPLENINAIVLDEPGTNALPQLSVPNTVDEFALNAGTPFDVQAINVIGTIDLDGTGVSESDFYLFHADQGFLTVEVQSRGLRQRIDQPIDSAIRVYDAATGEKVPFYGNPFGAFTTMVSRIRTPCCSMYRFPLRAHMLLKSIHSTSSCPNSRATPTKSALLMIPFCSATRIPPCRAAPILTSASMSC